MIDYPAFGAIVTGDEILSGKRQDAHFGQAIKILKQRGLSLTWAEYLGDKPTRITSSLKRSMATDDIVFSLGGIGATPDDYTRQCAAFAPSPRERVVVRAGHGGFQVLPCAFVFD